MRLLLVEDEVELSSILRTAFTKAGFAVDAAGDLGAADAASRAGHYDVVVLDRRLPDGDGLAFLRSLRRRGLTTPVVCLTARDEIRDRIEGLDSGADDYCVKPFDTAELLARIRALLRRPKSVLGSVLACGNVTLDTTTREVSAAGRRVALSRRETMLLENLMRRAGRVSTRAVLEDALYTSGEDVTPNSIEVSVSRLRKSLVQAAATVQLRTVRGVGYLVD